MAEGDAASAGAERRTLKANEVGDKILRGEGGEVVILEEVRITGNLHLPFKTIAKRLQFIRCEFLGSVQLFGATASKRVPLR